METNQIILIAVCVVSAISFIGLCVALVILLKRIKAYDKVLEQERFLISSNKESIQKNKIGIDANKEQIGKNRERIGNNAEAIAKLLKQMSELAAAQSKLVEENTAFKTVIKGQMFVHEANLLMDHGLWCLEHEGERKFFKPAQLQRVVSPKEQEDSVFEYDMESKTVKCTVSGPEGVRAEIIYTMAGAPKRGKIFKEGVVAKQFEYNELGQVI